MSSLRSMTAIAGALAVMGCASVTPERPAGPFVVPSQTVRHGMDADAHYRTGRYFQGQVRFDQAIDAYRRVLAAQPDHVDALNALGVIHSLQHQPELAEQYFRLALAADPLAARVHNNLGYHLQKSGRAAEAIVAFERARELDPGNADTKANLLAARVAMGLPGEAATAAAPAIAPAAPVAALVALAAPAATATTATTAAAATTPPTVPVALDRVADGVWILGSAKSAPPAASPAATATVTPAQATAAMGAAPAAGRVEVSNGNGATGLARRIAGILVPASALRARLTNDRPYGVQVSRIQYVGGSEQLAQDINARLPAPLPMARIESLERNVRVRVLLGKDFPPQPLAAQLSTWRNS